MGTNKNAIKMIAKKEDWKNDSNGRVAYQLIMLVEINKIEVRGDLTASAAQCPVHCAAILAQLIPL
jgi:hypothetical protein